VNIFPGQPIAVLEQDTALQVYLGALLQDMSVSAYAENPQKIRVAEKTLDQDDILGPMAAIQKESAPFVVDGHNPPEKSLTWATAPFQSLLFSANGIKMVVPLVQLHSIVDLTAPIKAMPGNAAWFMGLWPWRGTHVKVIDICKLMAMKGAELKSAELKNPGENIPKRIVLINDGSWGFVCDEVSEIFTLSPGQVKWRADRTHHAWLAGTVLEHMCALLDVDGLAPWSSACSAA
jgi:purine-binding chemotaxis protein CheW